MKILKVKISVSDSYNIQGAVDAPNCILPKQDINNWHDTLYGESQRLFKWFLQYEKKMEK